MSEVGGIAGAIEEAVRGAGEPEEAVQWELPGLPLLAAAEPARADGAATPEEAERRIGRPPGSRNRRTEYWQQFLLARYRSPLVALAETYSRPVEQLAKELGCTKLEAMQLQMQAAKELGPYVHQKLPVDLQVKGQGAVLLSIEASPALAKLIAGQRGDDEEDTVEGRLLPPVEKPSNSEG